MLQRCGALQRVLLSGARRVSGRAFRPISPLTMRRRRGTLLSETTLHVPADVHFRERAPWRVGLVAMEMRARRCWRICMPIARKDGRS